MLRDHRYLMQPYEISVETLALCNAACTFCPYPSLDRKGVKLSDDMLESILIQVSEWVHPFYFSPFKVNEPLLDTRLISYLHRINHTSPHAMLRIFTNGSPLSDQVIDRLAELKHVAHLWVSLNSVDVDEHYALMKLDFLKIANRLDMLHAKVNNGKFKHVVILSRVVQSNEADAIFVKYCRMRWPRFGIQLIKKDGWLGYTEPQMNKVPQSPCARWWELSIMATGVASLCCMDGTGEYSVGNIHNQSLLDIYNQPKLLEMRKGLIERGKVSPCNRCTY